MRSPDAADEALEFLARLASEFTLVLNLGHLVGRVLEILRETAGFDSCMIGLIEERDADLLTIVGATGLCMYARDATMRRGHGPLWATIDACAPFDIPDIHADPRASAYGTPRGSGIYAPLLARGHAIGAIGVHRSGVSAFTGGDLELLALLATYLGGLFTTARVHERLAELAFADPLTEVPNRRAFLDRLGVELLRRGRTGRPLSLALVDLDGFKAVNDQHGHPVGDATLRHIAQTLKQGTRGYDMVARYGGDEFALLFPDTPRQVAAAISRRFRVVQPSWEPGGMPMPLTLSWGVAACPDDGDAADVLLGAADSRLYETKRSR